MASILDNLLTRIQSISDGLDNGLLVKEVLIPKEADILELQRQQLFEGISSSGEDIHPYYSEDLKPEGYFYSAESAGRYAAWKQSLSYPYEANRNPDAPNLYINGRFHDELGVQFGADALAIIGTTSYAEGIIGKYGITTFGLTGQNWDEIFSRRGGYDDLLNKVKEIIYA